MAEQAVMRLRGERHRSKVYWIYDEASCMGYADRTGPDTPSATPDPSVFASIRSVAVVSIFIGTRQRRRLGNLDHPVSLTQLLRKLVRTIDFDVGHNYS
jgi:hypothetical protein